MDYEGYDVFISYAHLDGDWVRPHLADRLERCRTPEGRRPRVFFDRGKEGIHVADAWMEKLVRAIRTSKKFIAVYTQHYCRQQMCLWELEEAQYLDPRNVGRRITPLLLDPLAEQLIPLSMQRFQYLPTSRPGWFEDLLRELGWAEDRQAARLSILDGPPAETAVNHTLPPVRVQLVGSAGEEEVAVALEGGELCGTLAVTTRGGVATFDDLSVAAPLASGRLVVSVRGLPPALSAPFRVQAPPVREIAPAPARPPVAPAGEALFFASGKAALVIDAGRAAVHGLAGERFLAPVPLEGPPRVVRRQGGAIVLADWAGHVHRFGDDGAHHHWCVGPAEPGGFNVVGDLALDGAAAYAGLWGGAVWRLSPGEAAYFGRHEGGVQALAVAGGRLYAAGLDGQLALFGRDGRVVQAASLGPDVRLLQAWPDCLVAVGERRAWQVRLPDLRVIPDVLPLGAVAGVLGDVEAPVVIDEEGRGGRVTRELELRGRFATAAGAWPTSADREGRLCVFANPDGSRTLMVDGRTCLTHIGGTLAVSPDGATCVVGGEGGLRAVPLAELLGEGGRP